jgi:hypothetical protein
MEVAVQISGNRFTPGVEKTFTENVSARGARVRTVCRWEPNDRLTIVLHRGEFRATARVTYCQPLRNEGFAIGLEFLEPTGQWIISAPAARENR